MFSVYLKHLSLARQCQAKVLEEMTGTRSVRQLRAKGQGTEEPWVCRCDFRNVPEDLNRISEKDWEPTKERSEEKGFLACVEVGIEEVRCFGGGRGRGGVRQWLYWVKEKEVSDGLTGCCVGPGVRLEAGSPQGARPRRGGEKKRGLSQ